MRGHVLSQWSRSSVQFIFISIERKIGEKSHFVLALYCNWMAMLTMAQVYICFSPTQFFLSSTNKNYVEKIRVRLLGVQRLCEQQRTPNLRLPARATHQRCPIHPLYIKRFCWWYTHKSNTVTDVQYCQNTSNRCWIPSTIWSVLFVTFTCCANWNSFKINDFLRKSGGMNDDDNLEIT